MINPIANIDLSSCTNLIKASCGGTRLIDNQFIGYLENLNVTGLSNLKELYCSGNLLSSLDLTGLSSLEVLDCNGVSNINPGNITSLNINNLSNLKKLYCGDQKITSLDASNLVNLTDLYCGNNLITTLNLNGLINLVNLNYSYNNLSNVSLINLPNLKTLGCAYNQLTTLNVLNLTNLETLNCSRNQLTTLNLSGLSNLKNLDFSENQLSLTNISGLSTLLESLDCSNNSLTSLDLTGLNNLNIVSCNNNLLSSINLTGLNNLISLNCVNNQLTNIDLSSLLNLKYLSIGGNQLTNLDISNQTQLLQLNCRGNLLTSLDLVSHPNLGNLDYSSNNIPNLDVSFLTNLVSLECDDTQSTILDVQALTNLQVLSCRNNFLTTIDVSNQSNFGGLLCSNNLLTTLFIKNGKNEQNLDLSGNSTLQYICADDSQLVSIQSQLNAFGMNATVSNSYCTFTPGGNNNTITGLTIYDDDNNGCDITDEVNPFIRFNITDGTTTGATVTNINGGYTFFANAGNYTLSPNVENPTWFTFSPSSANFVFPDNNNNISNQNFCINAVGIHNDIEVAFHQTDVARPGFDAPYKIVFKNKGNQMVSGTINLAFNDDKTDFVSSTPTVNTQSTNSLTWNYINLMPFESRSISFNLNINSPVETPAVNIGDILNFVTTINPVTDDIPADNTFNYNQTVVGSFDPNSIECLEGESVNPSYIGQYLHYGVNFENTGNYPAENIVVKVIIDTTKYDMNSLQLMDTSHNSYTRITGNIAEFIFETINLDSGGHGNILFKIKTLNELSSGDMVNKRADIFFDYNAPIDTGMANTTFQTLSNGNFEIDDSISVYPNPTKSNININCQNTIKTIQLYDVQGRLLETKLVDDLQTSIDISEKSKGIYFLKITSDNGSKVVKVVKE
jgi:Leucine-rich repeat (LRR) protein